MKIKGLVSSENIFNSLDFALTFHCLNLSHAGEWGTDRVYHQHTVCHVLLKLLLLCLFVSDQTYGRVQMPSPLCALYISHFANQFVLQQWYLAILHGFLFD